MYSDSIIEQSEKILRDLLADVDYLESKLADWETAKSGIEAEISVKQRGIKQIEAVIKGRTDATRKER